MRVISLGLIFLFCTGCASTFIDLNAFYLTDTYKVTTTTTSAKTFYTGHLGFTPKFSKRLVIGWDYTGQTVSDNDGSTTTTYTSTQMGPGVMWFVNRKRTWLLGLGYHLVSTATVDDGSGGTPPEWRGAATQAFLGYLIEMGEESWLSARVNYNSVSYSESVTDTTKTDIAYARTFIYPSLGYTIEF